MDLKVFTAILLSVVVVGLVVLSFLIFEPFLLALLWAAVLAMVSYRPYEWLCGRLGGRRRAAALLMTVLVLLLILGPFLTFSLYFFEDAVNLANDLRPAVLESRIESIMTHPLVKQILTSARDLTGAELTHGDIANFLTQHALGPLVLRLGQAMEFLFHLLAAIVFIALSIFYFYKDGRQAVRVVRELIPMSDPDRDAILGDIHSAVVAAVRGGLVTAVVQGFLGLIILFILGISNPVLWACIMALASLIPLVGTAIVWVPMGLLLILDGEIGAAIALFAYGVLVIAMADNLLRPILVGQHMQAHPLLLFFGIIGGIALFGFAGVILGPVVVAFLAVTTRLFRREFALPTSP